MAIDYPALIRQFEGYTERAKWDYKQLSNGFGTKARFPGEVIGPAEAEKRFKEELDGARAFVERVAPNVDEGTKAALSSLTFNAGGKWASSGLGDAIRRGDLESARTIFVKYDKAGGTRLEGLTRRREVEASWFGQGVSGGMPAVDSARSRDPGGPAADWSAACTTAATDASRAGSLLAPASGPDAAAALSDVAPVRPAPIDPLFLTAVLRPRDRPEAEAEERA